MPVIQCNRCGQNLAEGTLKYRVDVKVRSMFDGVIPDSDVRDHAQGLDTLMAELSKYSEEELVRQVYEDDSFVLCPTCKEAFMKEIYARLHTKASSETGRDHLIH